MYKEEKGFTLLEVIISVLILTISIGTLCTSLKMYISVKKDENNAREAMGYAQQMMSKLDTVLTSGTTGVQIAPEGYGVSIIGIPLINIYKEATLQLEPHHLDDAWVVTDQSTISTSYIKEMLEANTFSYKVLSRIGNEQAIASDDFLIILTVNDSTNLDYIYYQMLGIKRMESYG